jgi:hypothetical protein
VIVSISASLTEPPSSVSCFRDVTLYSHCFLNNENLLECRPELKDIYWRWLKKHGAWDFVDDIVERNQEYSISIRRKKGSISIPVIEAYNLNFILATLRQYSVR